MLEPRPGPMVLPFRSFALALRAGWGALSPSGMQDSMLWLRPRYSTPGLPCFGITAPAVASEGMDADWLRVLAGVKFTRWILIRVVAKGWAGRGAVHVRITQKVQEGGGPDAMSRRAAGPTRCSRAGGARPLLLAIKMGCIIKSGTTRKREMRGGGRSRPGASATGLLSAQPEAVVCCAVH